MERLHLRILDRFYPIEEDNRSIARRHFLDSMGNRYPQLHDPVYYRYLQKKELVLNPIPFRYSVIKTPISPDEYKRLITLINASGYWRLPFRTKCPDGGREGGFYLEANTPKQRSPKTGSIRK